MRLLGPKTLPRPALASAVCGCMLIQPCVRLLTHPFLLAAQSAWPAAHPRAPASGLRRHPRAGSAVDAQ